MTTKILVTGVAGFIGSHIAAALLARGDRVLGVDNLSPYYSPALKHARLARLAAHRGFAFEEVDVTDEALVEAVPASWRDVERVVHAAAQPGVRHSLAHPVGTARVNLLGQVVIEEAIHRHLPKVRGLVYASTSSVYGRDTASPFSPHAPALRPVSAYAASKRGAELMAESYTGLYGLPHLGLRFFTVYGRWGRPDMAYFIFTHRILGGQPIKLFGGEATRRDFTHVDDIVAGVLSGIDRVDRLPDRHTILNLGNNRPERVIDLIRAIEGASGREAAIEVTDLPPGDVPATAADITPTTELLGFRPTTRLADGIADFVAWFREADAGRFLPA
ncbi:MAG: NAD-dependent epimerase/dehydratase family protein [Azospirillaceae bacterium]